MVSSVGPFVERFETSVADFVGTNFGVATVNGTAAIHIALKIAGVEAGDEVLDIQQSHLLLPPTPFGT